MTSSKAVPPNAIALGLEIQQTHFGRTHSIRKKLTLWCSAAWMGIQAPPLTLLRLSVSQVSPAPKMVMVIVLAS